MRVIFQVLLSFGPKQVLKVKYLISAPLVAPYGIMKVKGLQLFKQSGTVVLGGGLHQSHAIG